MFDQATKRAIIAGIITTLIGLIFLQPLVSLLWTVTQAIASRFSKSFADAVYQSAALGQTQEIDLLFLTLFMAVFWGFTVGVIVRWIMDGFGRGPQGGDVIAWIRRNSGIVIWLLLLAAVDGGVTSGRRYAAVQLNASFHQRLTALAPYITDQRGKELLSMWALMRTREDYDRINAALESHAKDHNIDLPEPRLR